MHNQTCNYVIHTASSRFIGVETGHPSLTPAGCYKDVTGEVVGEEIHLKTAYSVVEIPVEMYGHPHCECEVYDTAQDSKRRDMDPTEILDYNEKVAEGLITNSVTAALIDVISSVAGEDVTAQVVDVLKEKL